MNAGRRLVNTGSLAAMGLVERSVPRWPLPWVERRQRQRVRRMVRHAYATVPFYREAMDERGLRPEDFRTADDLAQLPLIDGSILSEREQDFLSSGYGEHNSLLFYTSGTSHVEKRIHWDRASVGRRLTYAERDRPILNRLIGRTVGQRQLYFLPEASTSLAMRDLWNRQTLIPRRLTERHYLSVDSPFEAIIARINAVRPHVVYSYGAEAELFFRRLADQPVAVALPRVWMYGGDTLSPDGRRLIEERFGCLVYSTYQGTETGRIGFQCERRAGFHLNIDLCATRLVDEAGRTVAPGQAGEVVISNLINHATVLLNYRLGDRGIMASDPCPCGRSLPVLASLEGRVSDVFTLADGRQLSMIALEGLHKHELSRTLQNQLVQDAAGRLIWRIVPARGVDPAALQAAIIARTRASVGTETPVAVECVEEIDRTSGGKRPRLAREVTHGQA